MSKSQPLGDSKWSLVLSRILLILKTFRHLVFLILVVLPLFCLFAVAEKIDERRS